MKTNKFILVLAMLIFTGVSAFAQLDRSKRPEPAPAPEIKIPEAQTFTLDNGLKVFVVENHKVPKVTFNFIFDYPPVYEGELAGLSSVTGQLIGTGTTTKTKDEIDEAVDFIGADLYASSESVYGSVLSDYKEDFVKILSDVLINAKFNDEELEKVKKRTISGIKSGEKNPSTIANNVLKTVLYGKDSPYGEVATEESVKKIELDDCVNFYKSNILPNDTYLAIVGDISFDDAKSLIEKYFSTWQKGNKPESKFKSKRPPLIRKVYLVDRPEAVQSVIHVAYPVKFKYNSKDRIAATIMNEIFGGNFMSHLNMNLREKHGYTYGARSMLSPDEYMGEFDAMCEARTEVTDSAITQFLYEMKRMRKGEVTQEELDAIKKYKIGQFARALEDPLTVAKFSINVARYNLPKDYYKNYLKNIDAVTLDDIKSAAKKYVNPEKAYVMVVGNGSEIKDKIKRFALNGKVVFLDVYGNEFDPNVKKVAANVTPEQIVDKYLNAIGGKEKLLSVNDIKVEMSGKVMNFDITMTVAQKKPGKFYSNMDAGVMQSITKFDGEKGVIIAMGQKKPMDEKQIAKMKAQAEIFPLADYAKNGIKLELVGVEQINGKDAYKIKAEFPGGSKKIYYFDKESGLKVRETQTQNTNQGQMVVTTDLSDYKDIDGIKYPTKMTQSVGGQVIELEVKSVKMNSGLPDDLFKVED